jgi:hypothetical protein
VTREELRLYLLGWGESDVRSSSWTCQRGRRDVGLNLVSLDVRRNADESDYVVQTVPEDHLRLWSWSLVEDSDRSVIWIILPDWKWAQHQVLQISDSDVV